MLIEIIHAFADGNGHKQVPIDVAEDSLPIFPTKVISVLLERSFAFSFSFDCFTDCSDNQVGLIDRNHMRAVPRYDLFTRSR